MAAVASHLADTSALARLTRPPVAAVLGPLIEAGLVATCGVIEFELGWATRSGAEFDLVRADRQEGYEWLATHDEDWHRALDMQAGRGAAAASVRHRALTHLPVPRSRGGTLRVRATADKTPTHAPEPIARRPSCARTLLGVRM